jgi:quercetin dioxygenase-like cupin family protein
MGDVMTMPDGSEFEVVRSPADPERDPSEVRLTAKPDGPAPPPHVHPRQREVFTLEEGDFELLLDGEWRRLAPGESVAVEAGQTHTYRNRGPATAHVRTVHEPVSPSSGTFATCTRPRSSTAWTGSRRPWPRAWP